MDKNYVEIKQQLVDAHLMTWNLFNASRSITDYAQYEQDCKKGRFDEFYPQLLKPLDEVAQSLLVGMGVKDDSYIVPAGEDSAWAELNQFIQQKVVYVYAEHHYVPARTGHMPTLYSCEYGIVYVQQGSVGSDDSFLIIPKKYEVLARIFSVDGFNLKPLELAHYWYDFKKVWMYA